MGFTSYKFAHSCVNTWNSWAGTREEYDALVSKNDNTLYYIMDEWDAWDTARSKIIHDWQFSSYSNLKDRTLNNNCIIIGTKINQSTSYLTKTNTSPDISSYVKTTDNVTINLATDFAISFGLKLKSESANVIVNDSSTTNFIAVYGSTGLLTIQTSNNNKVSFDISSIEDYTIFHSFTVSYENTEDVFKLYIDGEYAVDGVVVGTPSNLIIERFLGGYNPSIDLNGDSGLKYVKIFDSTLTAGEAKIFT